MPITQSRLHALLLAAESCAARHDALATAIHDALNDPDADFANAAAQALASTHNSLDPLAMGRIAAERTHYNLTHKRNARDAGRRRQDRGQDFYEPRLTSTPYEGPTAHTAEHIPRATARAMRHARAPGAAARNEENWIMDDAQEDAYVPPDLGRIEAILAQADAPPQGTQLSSSPPPHKQEGNTCEEAEKEP